MHSAFSLSKAQWEQLYIKPVIIYTNDLHAVVQQMKWLLSEH